MFLAFFFFRISLLYNLFVCIVYLCSCGWQQNAFLSVQLHSDSSHLVAAASSFQEFYHKKGCSVERRGGFFQTPNGSLQVYDLSIKGAIRRTRIFSKNQFLVHTTSFFTRLSILLITDKKNCVGFPFLGVKAVHGNCKALVAFRKKIFQAALPASDRKLAAYSKTCFQFPRKFLTRRREKPKTLVFERSNGHLNRQRGMKTSLSSDVRRERERI